MDVAAVTFPAMIISDDGWVELIGKADELKLWRRSAILKYNKRHVLLYDAADHAWRLGAIVPEKPLTWVTRLLAQTFHNPRVAVRLELDSITESPLQVVRDMLDRAINVDDDILTQESTARNLREAVQKAASFEAFIAELRRSGAIAEISNTKFQI